MKLTLHPTCEDGLRIEVVVEFTPARPGRWYLSNGDPGYPDEPEEVEFLDYRAWLHTDLLPGLPATCDEVRVESESIERWCEAWVDSEAGRLAASEAYEQQHEQDMEAA